MFDDFFEEQDQQNNAAQRQRAQTVFERLDTAADGKWERTAVQETRDTRDPFRTLVASILSARTREEQTRAATQRLFEIASTPAEVAALDEATIREAIQMVSYEGSKAGYLKRTAQRLVEEYDDNVPQELESLQSFPGVGWKTGVLTQWIAFGIAEEICVDVHVARIGKRLGLVDPATDKPQAVSKELMQMVPEDLWGVWNPMMVRFGREICNPRQPQCDICPLKDICPQIGVDEN